MRLEIILALAVGFFGGIAFSVIGLVCLSDWLEDLEMRKREDDRK